MSGAIVNKEGTIDLAVRIVSCRGLLVGDFRSSDPFVKVYLGGKCVHKTRHIGKT